MKNYLIEKNDQILSVTSEHISGGYDISAVFYKDHCLYIDEPTLGSIKQALNNNYELLGIIQGRDFKEIKRQLKHMTEAL